MKGNSNFERDLYEVLHVQPDATADEIRAAYHRLVKRYHPDKGGRHESDRDREYWTDATAELNAAWETLKDAERRSEYDRHRAATTAQEDGSGPAQEEEPRSSAWGPPPPPPPHDRYEHSRTAGNPHERTQPQVHRATKPGLGRIATALLLLLGAVWAQAAYHAKRSSAELQAGRAGTTAVMADQAREAATQLENQARTARRAARRAFVAAWQAELEADARGIAVQAARLRRSVRITSRAWSIAAAAARALALAAQASSWGFSFIPGNFGNRLEGEADDVRATAEEWHERSRRNADGSRRSLQAWLGGLEEAEADARYTATVAWAEHAELAEKARLASDQAHWAQTQAERAETAATRTAEVAVDADEDAAFRRTIAAAVSWAAAIMIGFTVLPWFAGTMVTLRCEPRVEETEQARL